MTIKAFSVRNGFVYIFAGKGLCVVAGIAQVGRLPEQKLLVIALVRRMAAIAHTDLERPMFFFAHELFVHVAFKAERRSRLGQQEL